jgi:hypothetical protein
LSVLTSTRHLTDLAPTLEGKVVLPDDAGFDAARRAWNLAVDQRPSMVVFPETAADVAAAVRLARGLEQRIAPQATGHNAEPLGSLENTILLRTERMRAVTIDPTARSARAEAGSLPASWRRPLPDTTWPRCSAPQPTWGSSATRSVAESGSSLVASGWRHDICGRSNW